MAVGSGAIEDLAASALGRVDAVPPRTGRSSTFLCWSQVVPAQRARYRRRRLRRPRNPTAHAPSGSCGRSTTRRRSGRTSLWRRACRSWRSGGPRPSCPCPCPWSCRGPWWWPRPSCRRRRRRVRQGGPLVDGGVVRGGSRGRGGVVRLGLGLLGRALVLVLFVVHRGHGARERERNGRRWRSPKTARASLRG